MVKEPSTDPARTGDGDGTVRADRKGCVVALAQAQMGGSRWRKREGNNASIAPCMGANGWEGVNGRVDANGWVAGE